ncbi:MAG: response regulator, partial [Nostoc sp.]
MNVLRFLLLEDSLLDAELTEAILTEGGINCELIRVETGADFLAALETEAFDLILADYALPS